MNTFKTSTLGLLAFSLVSSIASATDAKITRVLEIPLEKVFVARIGFDDNDNVQGVVEGTLPNACYTLGTTEFTLARGSNDIVITQKAIHDESGICADETNLPAALKQVIPFWAEVNFGVLPTGSYRASYSSQAGIAARDFSVGPAPTASVDSQRYAIITNAFAPDTNGTSQAEIEFRITGYLTSSCAEISQNSRVEKIDDVYVFLPQVTMTEDICMPSNKPFYKIVRVPTPAAGSYLLHVRSQAGQARNKPFKVLQE